MVQLSLDGVQESNSSLVSLDTFSICFNGCRNIYPVRIVKPINKYKIDEQEQILRVVEDINANGLILHSCVLDKPKRSVLKCALSQSAYHACEYCECPAELVSFFFKDKDNQQRSKKKLVWPLTLVQEN